MSRHDVSLASRLRREADRYRELAEGAVSWATVLYLIELAEECDREAASLVDRIRERETLVD